MLSPISLLPAVASLFIALLCVKLITLKIPAPSPMGRYASIDGLRGYLAFFVFLHHSCIWYFYLKTGHWTPPPSNIYTNFGQGSVAFFFMITGFLFFGKLLDQKNKNIDWVRIFSSRILRLTPLYFFVTTLVILIAFIISDFTIKNSVPYIIKTLMQWFGFTVFGSPDINGVRDTYLIVAGVTWSLPYEWLFYLTLPIMALCIGNISSVPFLIFSFVVIGFLYFTGIAREYTNIWHLSAFLSGMLAALLVRYQNFNDWSKKWFSSVILIVSILCAGMMFSSTYSIGCILLLFLAFSLIAGGNTAFGLFNNPLSRTLGEMAYSIYLLHGILLFVVFNFIVGKQQAALLSAQVHWTIIFAATPILIFVSFLSYRYIERPAMNHTASLTYFIKTMARRKKASLDGII